MKPGATRLALAVLLPSLWLGGCGFRLAGTEALPQSISALRVVTRDFSEAQAKALKNRLRRAGARLITVAGEAGVELDVRLLAPADRNLVYSASNGKTVQRITRSLSYSLRGATGEVLVANRILTQQSEIVLDDDNLLASDQEKANVVSDLHSALYNQLIRQLSRI